MGGSMDKKLIKAYLPWGLCAGIFTIAAASGLFYEMDNRLSDALYQERRGTDGRIAIVGSAGAFWHLGPADTGTDGFLSEPGGYPSCGYRAGCTSGRRNRDRRGFTSGRGCGDRGKCGHRSSGNLWFLSGYSGGRHLLSG